MFCYPASHAFQTRRFAYCLQCLKLGSTSWFDFHKTKEIFDISEETLAKHVFRFPQYVQDITTENEMMHDAGKMFQRVVVETVPDPRLDLPESPVQPGFRPLEQFNESYESDSEDGGDFDPEDCEEDDFSFKRLVDCLTECFDRFCFLHGSFDSSTFISLAQTFFPENGNENFSLTKDRFMLLKGKVISFVMKKVFVILALTKNQIDKLNALFKAVLFVTGEGRKLCKHIHAGYLS